MRLVSPPHAPPAPLNSLRPPWSAPPSPRTVCRPVGSKNKPKTPEGATDAAAGLEADGMVTAGGAIDAAALPPTEEAMEADELTVGAPDDAVTAELS